MRFLALKFNNFIIIIHLPKRRGLVCPLEEEMTDKWIEEFLFPEKTLGETSLA